VLTAAPFESAASQHALSWVEILLLNLFSRKT